MDERFCRFAHTAAETVGRARTFAVIVITIWAETGPVFHFSDTWQLVIKHGRS